MTQCVSCGNEIGAGAGRCPVCQSEVVPGGTVTSEANPYQVSEAVIDARSMTPMTSEDMGDYDVKFGVSETISETFRIWQASLGRLVLISLIPAIPVVLASVTAIVLVAVFFAKKMSSFFNNPSWSGFEHMFGGVTGGIMWGVGFVVFVLVLMTFTFPAFVGQFRIMDEQTRLGESRVGVWTTYWESFRFVLPLVGLLLLAYLGVIVAMVPIALMVKVPVLIVFYVLFLMVGLSFLAVRWCLCVPLMVLEGLSAFAALSRSNQMISGKTWPVMGIFGVMFAVMMGIGFGLSMLGLIPILGQLVGMGAQLAIAPLQTAVIFAIYAGLKSPQFSIE